MPDETSPGKNTASAITSVSASDSVLLPGIQRQPDTSEERSHRQTLTVVQQSDQTTICAQYRRSAVCGLRQKLHADQSDRDQSDRGDTDRPVAHTGCLGCSALFRGAGKPSVITLPASLLQRETPDHVVVSVGDSIELEAPASMLLALSLVIYLSPVILMLFFAVVCSLFFLESEAIAALSAAAGFSLGLGSIIAFAPKLRTLITRRLSVHYIGQA